MSELASKLWKANADLAEANLQCAFVRGLAEGTLPRPRFQEYIKQDAYFLEAFARAYALALAATPDREGLHTFAGLLTGVLEELKLHAAYANRWQVDLRNLQPAPATTAYVDFLLATARTGRVGEICAAMTPCMRLYAFLGQQLQGTARKPNDYAEWIGTYASPGFEALAMNLESLLGMYAQETEQVETLYRNALTLELAFFQEHAP